MNRVISQICSIFKNNEKKPLRSEDYDLIEMARIRGIKDEEERVRKELFIVEDGDNTQFMEKDKLLIGNIYHDRRNTVIFEFDYKDKEKFFYVEIDVFSITKKDILSILHFIQNKINCSSGVVKKYRFEQEVQTFCKELMYDVDHKK